VAASETEAPELSVVVTIVDGGATLERCLDALVGQVGAPSMEVLVPYDHMSRETAQIASRYPDFIFVDLGEILGGMTPENALEEHRFYDVRRSGALKIARGRLVSIIEDRGVPKPDWAAAITALHDGGQFAAIGGAVENGSDRIWNWAIFFCDFGRYQAPLADDDPEYVTDTNICYRRDALESVRHLWDDHYEEAAVNWALRRNGARLLLSDRPRTVQLRDPVGFRAMALERFHWGRVYGRMRGRETDAAGRLKYCLVMPALPALLLLRHFRRQLDKGHHVGKFVAAIPAILFLLSFWAAGEFAGYRDVGRQPAENSG